MWYKHNALQKWQVPLQVYKNSEAWCKIHIVNTSSIVEENEDEGGGGGSSSSSSSSSNIPIPPAFSKYSNISADDKSENQP